MIRRPPRSTQSRSSAASDVYKRQTYQSFAGPVVELGGDPVQVFAAVHTQVGALGEVLAKQAVRILIGAPLPGACGSQKKIAMSVAIRTCFQSRISTP